MSESLSFKIGHLKNSLIWQIIDQNSQGVVSDISHHLFSGGDQRDILFPGVWLVWRAVRSAVDAAGYLRLPAAGGGEQEWAGLPEVAESY